MRYIDRPDAYLIFHAKAAVKAARAWTRTGISTSFGHGAHARCLREAAIYRRALAHKRGITLSPMI